MIRTDDPLRDFNRWEDEQYLWELSRPVCFDCGNPITGEYKWVFHGQDYCEDCVRDHRERIDE